MFLVSLGSIDWLLISFGTTKGFVILPHCDPFIRHVDRDDEWD